MKALIQRVSDASVYIDCKKHAAITKGMCIFLGIKSTDSPETAEQLVDKILKLRIFSDITNKMNQSISDINGQILVVSQFTLYADTTKGNRPSFHDTASKLIASPLYELFINLLKEKKMIVKSGQFGTNMNVELNNSGPVTIMLEVI